jgi:hypothetical protein
MPIFGPLKLRYCERNYIQNHEVHRGLSLAIWMRDANTQAKAETEDRYDRINCQKCLPFQLTYSLKYSVVQRRSR